MDNMNDIWQLEEEPKYIGPYTIGMVHYFVHTVDRFGGKHMFFESGTVNATLEEIENTMRERHSPFTSQIVSYNNCDCPWCSGLINIENVDPRRERQANPFQKKTQKEIMRTRTGQATNTETTFIQAPVDNGISSAADSLLSSFKKSIGR
jgi:hypothetical protein